MLKGNTYCLSPTLLTKTALSQAVRKHGGKVITYLSNAATHVLASSDEIKHKVTIVQKAHEQGIPIVSDTRLLESLASTSPPGSPLRHSGFTRLNGSSDTLSQRSALLDSDGAAPTLSLLLPDNGPNTGNFKVAAFGLGFVPGAGFRLKFGHMEATSFEFHSSTSLVCTFPACNTRPMPVGDVICSASNDGGKTWGFPLSFRFYDAGYNHPAQPEDTKVALLTSQLANVRRAVANIQQMELDLRNQLEGLGSSRPALPAAAVETSSGSEIPSSPDMSQSQALAPLPKPVRRFNREIRLFISSPFTDMQQERDSLVRVVIPKIRKMCMDRDLAFSYVDLRWGVTSNQAESATALLMCLRELESCNLFVGFWGERYGWSTAGERDSGKVQLLQRSIEIAAKEYPWVRKYADRSMTELEMRMVLDKLHDGEPKAAWFYLRDPYYVEEVPATEKHLFTSEGPHSKQKLDALKDEIDRRVSPRQYPRPPALADYVFEDIKDHIERYYPADQTLSVLERERFRHNVYMNALTRVYLPNEEYLMQLDKFVSTEIKKPFVISGEAGIGKSALLANWASRHIVAHPEDVVIHHWIGSSPGSSSYGEILSRILAEIRNIFEVEDMSSLSSKSEEVTAQQISKEFLNSLKNLMTKHNHNHKRVIIIIDGLNKLDERDSAHDLVWFPHTFPKLVRMVVSSTPHFVLDVLRKRKCESLEVKPLEEGQRKSFTRLYLNLLSKHLDEKLEFKIAQAPQTANPRYLKTLLDDVAAFGKHEQLAAKIDVDLQATMTSALYEIVLQRLEQDFDRNVVKTFLTLLWASRRGLLLNNELGVILSGKKFKFSEESWSSFFIAADETLLADCSGLVLFANQDVRSAVERRYLRTQGDKIAVHSELAEFFSALQDLTERKIEELPHQLEHASKFSELRDTLCDLNMFSKLYEDAHKFDLLRYWRELEKQNMDVYKSYDKVLSQDKFPSGVIIGDLLFRLGRFMLEMAKYEGAETIFKKSMEYYMQSSQTLSVAKVQSNLAELYLTQSRLEESEEFLKRALNVYEREKGTEADEIASICSRLGSLFTIQKKFQEALVQLQRARRIAESAFGVDSIPTADVIYNMAYTFLCMADPDSIAQAEKLLLQALEIKELQLGSWDPEISHILLRLGELYLEQNQFADAQECLERSLYIREQKLGTEHSRVAQTLKHMMTCYEMQEKYADALRVGFRALEITKKIFGAKHLHTSGILLRLGTVYLSMDDRTNAKKYIFEALEMRKELFGPTHRWSVEAEKALESLEPKVVPPPPPAPKQQKAAKSEVEPDGSDGMRSLLRQIVQRGAMKELEERQAFKAAMELDINTPPPPPPPLPGFFAPAKAPQQARYVPKVVAAPAADNWEAEIQSYQTAQLHKNQVVNDRGNAREVFRAMMGNKERKIQFKKKLEK